MNFPFSVRRVLGGNNITRLDSRSLQTSTRGRFGKEVIKIINEMGQASASAQQLGAVITTASKLSSSDHVVYMASNYQSALGFIKVGYKKLFIHTSRGGIIEMFPLCVLDFYVNENCQRQGIGLTLFEHMLKDQGIEPHILAYDRPSPKLLSFLDKHYRLNQYVPQTNNFVVYNNHPTFGGGNDNNKTHDVPSAIKDRSIRLNYAQQSYFDNQDTKSLEVGRTGTTTTTTRMMAGNNNNNVENEKLKSKIFVNSNNNVNVVSSPSFVMQQRQQQQRQKQMQPPQQSPSTFLFNQNNNSNTNTPSPSHSTKKVFSNSNRSDSVASLLSPGI